MSDKFQGSLPFKLSSILREVLRKYIEAISVYDRPCAFRDEKCFHAKGPFFVIKPFFTLKRLVSSLLQKKVYRRNTCTCWVPFIKSEMTRILRNSRICPDITSTYPSSARVYIGNYLQLQHAVSIPERNFDLVKQEPRGIDGRLLYPASRGYINLFCS